jgi:hypothetical protein
VTTERFGPAEAAAKKFRFLGVSTARIPEFLRSICFDSVSAFVASIQAM